jgi:hypothetical protein
LTPVLLQRILSLILLALVLLGYDKIIKAFIIGE